MRRAGEPIPPSATREGAERCRLVPLDETVVFTAGALSPTVVISRGAWERLDNDERRAAVAHEIAHVANGDLWRRAALGLASCFGFPGLAAGALRLWDLAAERICDRAAALAVGRSSIVASAIVSLARGSAGRNESAIARFVSGCHVTARVHALLDGEPDGAQDARWIGRLFCAAGLGLTVLAAIFSDGLHHFFETILG
jgi:hypothetical protein